MKPTALIVDDSEPDTFLATIFLEDSGQFSCVCSAKDGREALELFLDPKASKLREPNCFPPHIIFLDINMPRMTGFEFLEALGKLSSGHAPTVVVMVTSSDHQRDIERAKQYPLVKDYVTKPLSVEKIASIVDTCLA